MLPTRLTIRLRWPVLLAASALAGAPSVLPTPAGAAWARPSASISVGAVSGALSVQRGGRGGFARIGTRHPLAINDIVQTGASSKATILFPDGAQVRLNANSRIQITAPRAGRGGSKSLFRALGGQVWGRLRPGNAVETRTAALGVLGTEIHLDVAPDGTTTLTVTDGKVDFHNAFGSVIVNEKQQSVAREGAAPTVPVTVQNAGLIVEWSFDLNRAAIPREKFFATPDRFLAQSRLPRLAQAARQSPAQALARKDYGDALFDAGQFEPALAQFEAACKLAPTDARLNVRRGYALLELGRLDEAEAAMRGASAGDTDGATLVQSGAALQPVADGPSPDASTLGALAPALVGLADVMLERDEPGQAQALAQRAIGAGAPLFATVADDAEAAERRVAWSEAHLALGISLLRQNGAVEEAARALRQVLEAEPRALHYQARAWLSLAHLSQNETAQALREAREAVRLAPRSGLSRGNLALVAFYAGDAGLAETEANAALGLNPDSVSARVALGQALLAQGNVDEANRVAAQAVALDDDQPQARYLLGIADASRRDYRHAVRELRHAVDLAPGDLLARSALARTYTAIGQNAAAVQVLEAAPRRDSDGVLAALGEVLYEQGRYDQSVSQFQAAIEKNGGSALYQAGLARTLLASNQITSAIAAAKKAVAMAPNIGQYRAILGTAYTFANMSGLAEREFRDALLLDPNNALALTQLAYRHEGADGRPAAAGFAQGFLLDPLVARQLLRGGVSTEVAPQAGDRGSNGLSLANRLQASDGRVNAFGFFSNTSSPGFRPNDDRRILDAQEHITLLPDAKTNVYIAGRAQRDARGLAGSLSQPDGDDRSRLDYGQVHLAARRRLSPSSSLWLGLFGNASRNRTVDGARDSFFDPTTDLAVPSQRFTSRAVVPEVRLDTDLSRNPGRISRLSFGAALTNTRFRLSRDLFDSPGQVGNGLVSERNRGYLLYGQLTQQVGNKLSLSAQLRLQRLDRVRESRITAPNGLDIGSASSESGRSYILPNLLATYGLSKSTSLRLLHSDRITDVTSSTLAPSELLITNNASALPFGIPERTRLSQVELQRRISDRTFVRAFAFRTRANNVSIGYSDLLGFGGGLAAAGAPGLLVERWSGSGVGALLEGQLGRNLFFNAGATARRTRADSTGLGTAFSGGAAPYEPRFLGHLGLNYVDGKGYKVGVQLRRTGAFFQDTPLALERARFGGGNYVDLLLAREPGVGAEFYVNVTNLFNRGAIQFNGFPTGQRRVNFGVTRRF